MNVVTGSKSNKRFDHILRVKTQEMSTVKISKWLNFDFDFSLIVRCNVVSSRLNWVMTIFNRIEDKFGHLKNCCTNQNVETWRAVNCCRHQWSTIQGRLIGTFRKSRARSFCAWDTRRVERVARWNWDESESIYLSLSVSLSITRATILF